MTTTSLPQRGFRIPHRTVGLTAYVASLFLSTAIVRAEIVPAFQVRGADARRAGIPSETLQIAYDEIRIIPREIKPTAGVLFPKAIGAARADTDLQTAIACLEALRDSLALDDPGAELSLKRVRPAADGRRQLRFAQSLDGIPVWPSELVVHLDAAGNVAMLNGSFAPTPSHVSTTPVISEAEAIEAARRAANLQDAEVEGVELIIHNGDDAQRLAFKIELHANLATHILAIIDATNGEMIQAINTVCTGVVNGSGVDMHGQTQPLKVFQQGNTFLMIDASKPMFNPAANTLFPGSAAGTIFVADAAHVEIPSILDGQYVASNNPNSWPIPDSVSAAVSLSQTFDFYLDVLGRNSLDGNGGSLLAVVRFGQNYPNAFWNGELMVFGTAEPYAKALDVVAHELTHGVTQHESGLIYQNQSGALSEAFSDIFGEVVERFVKGQNDWLTGNDLSAPLRDFVDPNRLGLPNRMSQFVSLPNAPEADNGGVHINSSIINHCFFLLAEGMPGAIGMDSAMRIFYKANTEHLTQNSSFVDCRLACITSAQQLFGTNSTQAQKTAAAFDAVEIFGTAGPGSPSQPSGDDNFEPNDNANQAATITVGTHSLAGNNNDWFLLNMAQGGALSVAVSANTGDLDLYVSILEGNSLALLDGSETDGSSNESVEVTAPAGPVYILVAPFNGGTAPYTLTINGAAGPGPGNPQQPVADDEFEENDTLETLAPIQPGTHQLVGNDVDGFLLETAAGALVRVQIVGQTGDLNLMLTNSADVVSSKNEGSQEAGEIIATGGVVAILVEPYHGAVCSSYTMTIAVEMGNVGGDGDDAPPTADDKFEENDSLNEAALISSGTQSLVGNDDDWFALTIDTPGRLVVSIAGDSGDLDLAVVDAKGTILAASVNAGSNERIETDVPSGKLFIFVEPFNGQGGTYTLTIEEASIPCPEPEMCGAAGCGAMLASMLGIVGLGRAGRRRKRF